MMEEQKILNDISTLTQIPTHTLEKIADIISKEICHRVYTGYIKGEKNIIDLDLEIGTLSLKINSLDSTIEYSFKPSKQLEKELIETMRGKKSILTEAVSSNLNKKILNLYRELI